MAIKAMIKSGYRWRLAAVAVMCLGWATLCVKDGFFTYPEINRVRADYDQLKQQYDQKMAPEEFKEAWAAYQLENGLDIGHDEPDPRKSQFSMIAQYVMLAITLPIGLFFGYFYIASAGRWVAADDAGLSTSRGDQVDFAGIEQLNKDRWATKGIALVKYRKGDAARRIILDDWKYDRTATLQILRTVESHL